VTEELTALGLDNSAIEGILAATQLGSVEDLQLLLGSDNEAVQVGFPISNMFINTRGGGSRSRGYLPCPLPSKLSVMLAE